MRQGNTFRTVLLATSALVPLGLLPAYAGPQGGQVVGGSSTISTQGTTTTITQTTDRSVINWQTYNVGANEKVQYVQPNAGSVSLNRVTGGQGPSSIYGTISANGNVFIVNPYGVLIGASAVINTAGFLATTNDIKNDDFMAGRYHFTVPGRPDASVVNLGTITASNGGFAALVAPGVRNSGTITAKFGKIALASGNEFSLDFYGDGLITLGVNDSIAGQVKDVATGETLKSLVTNDGVLKANGGRVELTAVSARQVVDSVINTSGVIEARSIGHRNGMIVLGGQTSKTKVAGAPTQTVKVSGTLNVSGKKKGGTVKVTGENIQLASANIKATGGTGGGTVMIGGDTGGGKVSSEVASIEQAQLSGGPVPTADTVTVDANSVIDVSAKKTGNGGKAIIWSDLHTVFAGTVLAKGGALSGNGGFVEVSGKQTLAYNGLVDTRATNGVFGTLLLDPYNLEIWNNPSSGMSGFDANANNSKLDVSVLNSALATSNVVVTTGSGGTQDGDITVTGVITWNSAATLTLSAYRNIIINGQGTDTGTIVPLGSASLVLRADNTGTGTGTVTLAANTFNRRIDATGTNGTVKIYYNPTSYTSPTDYGTGNGRVYTSLPNQLRAYMLVNNATQLQNIATNLTGTYALGKNIDATVIPNFTPIGSESAPFIGHFDGDGRTIDGLTIAPTSASVRYIGLFGAIGSAGVVQNVNFTNASITANPNYTGGGRQYVGVLAGENFGTVNNVTVQGTINGGSVTNLAVGGLVGRNGAFISSASPVQGLIQNSSANVAITTGDGSLLDSNLVGGLVGDNPGRILESNATGNIVVGSNTLAGGLVGRNMIINGTTGPQPLIQDSWASGNVTSTGTNVGLGGLVGYNWGTQGSAISGMIKDSRATGNVTANAALSGNNCSFLVSCDFAWVGGLVGFNQGFILGTAAPNVVPGVPSQGTGTYATGNVSVGSGGTAGGLVGQNDGMIDKALATGAVVGAAGYVTISGDDRSTTLGGFVGQSNGVITNSTATGNVGSAGVDYLQIGGFAGRSGGLITTSHATGTVVAGSHSVAGGFAGDSAPSDDGFCGVCNLGVGYNNAGTITDSSATGSVTVGSSSAAGGFVAFTGDIANSTASGNVTGGGNSILGGFAAIVPTTDFIPFFVVNSHATGNVTSTGPNSWIGGFAGLNAGVISLSSATGNVQAISDSVVGGFAGLNIGWLVGVETHGFYVGTPQSISVSGNDNLVGGLVGANFGAITGSTSLAAITGNGTNTMGTLVGANGNLANVASGQIPLSSFPLGTIFNSTGSGTINGVAGAQVGTFNLAKMPASPAILNSCDDSLCEVLKNPKTISSDDDEAEALKKKIEEEFGDEIDKVIQIITLLSDNTKTNQAESGGALIQISSSDPAGTPGGTGAGNNPNSGGSTGVRTVSQTPGAPPPAPPPPPLRPIAGPDGERFSSIPPINENRFIQNEVVLQMGNNIPLAEVQRIAQQMGLTILSQQSLGALGRNAFRFNISGGRSVRDVIRTLEANSIVAVAQPNYQYKLSQNAAPANENKGDPAQYMVEKLQLEQVHRIVSGKNVTIAVIDSEADKQHTELQGQISEQFNAVGEAEKAHSHGTAMVGAISSRDRLLGVAPGAKILAVRAFSESQQSAEGTTFHILKSIDWAVSQGARVINMSFAGPRDPALERTLKKAYDQGVVLIAAAGNAGPKSPPLYPGADPSVIAVTATDAVDRGFKMANQGPHVSVASPGVDVLAPAPAEAYQMSTGTSIATAHVSGVVALMLERDPSLTPADVRRILEASATDLGPKGKDTQFGWGLVNPQKALQMVDERKRKVTEVQPSTVAR